MIKTIVAKWQAGANRSWDGNYPQPPICFFVFKDGDSDNFCGDNCVPILAYDYFSNPDARNWCVPVAQRSPDGMGVKIPGVKDISLTPHEEAFVHNNFEAFAAHFKPTTDSDRKALTAMYNDNTEDTVETEEQASIPIDLEALNHSMTTFNVAGVTHGALNDVEFPNEMHWDDDENDFHMRIRAVNLLMQPQNEHNSNAIGVELWVEDKWDENGEREAWNWRNYHIGYVPAALLTTAHADNWCDRDWTIDAIGAWTPPGHNRTVPYCRLASGVA